METRAERALALIREGYPAKEIVEILGYANITCVFNLAKSHGLKVAKAHDGLHEQMRRYKAEGHSHKEVAEHFCVSLQTAHNICKGISPQQSTPPRPKGDLHRCPVCGTITDNPKYCSDKCRKRANYIIQNTRRRAKIKNALIDEDITLFRLFERDNGRCHICGGRCDWEDRGEKNGRFYPGGNYPTIDHVTPLAKGGKHSWNNVKLAHHSCNSAKGAR